MPQAIPLIISVAGPALGWTATATAFASLAATAAVGLYERDRAKQKARDAYNKSLQDRLQPIRSGIVPRSYVLGTVRTSGALMYAETIGTHRQAFDVVLAIANNECELNGWYLNDDFVSVIGFPGDKYGRISDLDSRQQEFTVTGPTETVTIAANAVTAQNPVRATWRQGGVTGTATVDSVDGTTVNLSGLPDGVSTVVVTYTAGSSYALRAQFATGTESQTATTWAPDYSSPGWTSAHRLQGVANARTLYVWDENLYQQGAPAASVVATGRAMASHLFYDPRDASNPTTTKNPAILAGWWMTLPRSKGGCGIPFDWIDWQSVAAAANVCDEVVTFRNPNGIGYSQGARYECNTILSTADPPLQNLDEILSAMAGRRAFTCGKYKIVAGAFRPATMVLTDADVVGTKPLTPSMANGNDAPPNIVTATFSDAAQNWLESSPDPVRNADYVESDGHEEALDLVLPATTHAPRANYLMGVALEGSRPAMTIALSVGGIGEDIAIYDTVQLSLVNRSAYAGRTFEVIGIVDNWDGTFDLQLAEIRPQTWELDADTFTPINPVEPVDISYIWNPAVVAGFTVAAITPQVLPDGTAVSRVELAWDALPPEGNTPSAYIELRYRIAGGSWIGIASVPGDSVGSVITAALADGEVYQFQARFVNGVGARSAWIDAWTQIAGTPLPAPLSLRMRTSSTIFRVPQTGNALPVSITFEAVRTGGLTEDAVFETSPAVTLTGTGDSRTLTYANMGANDSVQVTCTVTQASVTYTDTVTILKVYDGADADDEPDDTPPPIPTGLAVQSFLVHLYASWDAPAYSVGHGHDATIVYAAPVPTGGPQPTFANAVAVGSSTSNSYQFAAAPGTRWAIWIRHQSRDGYLSPVAGGTNGVQQTTAQIGNTNLGPLVVEAGNLANGAVTSAKLVSGAVDATKFASGIEPVTIVTGALPTTFVTRTVFRTDDQKLYRWTGTFYTAAVAAADVAGQLTNEQIAALAAAKLTGQITTTQIGPDAVTAPKIAAGAVATLHLGAEAVTAEKIFSGAITTPKLDTGAVTADKLGANSVIAGKVAAGAISTNELAANAVTASKVAITGRGAALNDDPACVDATAWQGYSGAGSLALAVPSAGAPGGTVMRITGAIDLISRGFPVAVGKRYRITGLARKASGTGTFTFAVLFYQAGHSGPGQQFDSFVFVSALNLPGSLTRYSGIFEAPANAVNASIYIAANQSGTGDTDVTDIRVEEVIPGELIVDGAITARKLFITSGGGALNIDSGTQDSTAWELVNATIAQVTDTPGIQSVLRSPPGVHAAPFSRQIQFNPNKTYRVRARARSAGANGTFYLVVDLRDASNQIISGSGTYWLYDPSGISLPSSFTQYERKFGAGTDRTFPAEARTMRVGALLNYQGTVGYHEITDLLIEECVDAGLVVDGAIQAQHLAANSIAVGTAAIQNGAIVNAMIANAAIDNAKILNLQVDKITAGTLGADIAIGAGRITYDNGTFMKVEGLGFGTTNQFIEWFGPRPSGGNIALCSELNARSYKKMNGDEYMGGSISAGTFKNAAQTSDQAATANVELGPFTTNGNPKTIVLSYSYQRISRTNAGTGTITGGGSAQVILQKNVGSGWVTIGTLNVSAAGGNVIVDGDPGVRDTLVFNMSGSITVTDMQGATNNMSLRAFINSRSLPTFGGTGMVNTEIQQFTGFISTE